MNLPIMWKDEARQERIDIIRDEREYIAFWLAALALVSAFNLVVALVLVYLHTR